MYKSLTAVAKNYFCFKFIKEQHGI